jgi:pyruvate/2-oxoacid:ferredoxin oxidoreductase alpha subunit
MANVNRALGPPWNIWVDQTDSLAQRDTGWIQFYCESNQEVLDMVLQAFRLGEQVMLPVMINLDAFFLSHTSEPVAIPKQELVDRFLPPYKPKFKMDVNDPHAFGGLGGPNVYMEFRHNIQKSMEEAKRLIPIVAEEYDNLIGRHHGTMIEKYHANNADYLLITAGTLAGTTRIVVDELRKEGINIGMIKLRTFRPFPTEELRDAVKGVKKIGVNDRNISFGQSGIFFSEIKAALYNGDHHPLMNGYVAGLGGRDVVPANIRQIAEHMMASDKGQDLIWIGVKA